MDARLSGMLRPTVLSMRDLGATWPTIAEHLRKLTGVSVTRHTVRNWHTEYTNGRRNGSRGMK